MKMQGRKATIFVSMTIITVVCFVMCFIVIFKAPNQLMYVLGFMSIVMGIYAAFSAAWISINMFEKYIRLRNFKPELVERNVNETGIGV